MLRFKHIRGLLAFVVPTLICCGAKAQSNSVFHGDTIPTSEDIYEMYLRTNEPFELTVPPLSLIPASEATPDSLRPYILPDELVNRRFSAKGVMPSLYDLPYSFTGRIHDWHRLWINTAVLGGAFVGTLFVLECLPEDATAWNRHEIQSVPMFKRWYNHVIKEGPEWDHDKFIFNFVLHPYAGAAYFMAARSCGFNFWQSLLYSAIVSDVGWEFGIEAFMERPSYQDMFITPLVGSAIGEGFYAIKRYIANHDYRLLGTPVLGYIVAFLVDPVNEVVGYFGHNPAHDVARHKNATYGTNVSLTPMISPQCNGFSLVATF